MMHAPPQPPLPPYPAYHHHHHQQHQYQHHYMSHGAAVMIPSAGSQQHLSPPSTIYSPSSEYDMSGSPSFMGSPHPPPSSSSFYAHHHMYAGGGGSVTASPSQQPMQHHMQTASSSDPYTAAVYGGPTPAFYSPVYQPPPYQFAGVPPPPHPYQVSSSIFSLSYQQQSFILGSLDRCMSIRAPKPCS